MKKNKEITLVTSFFDIGRKDYGDYARSNKKYLDDFKFWARMKNNLVVYTDKEMAKEVKKIRKEFGLEEKTKIIIIEDITKLEPEIFSRMKEIENSDYFLSYRYKEVTPENKALYNYVMLIKSWCISDAVKQGVNTEFVAWLDFGYNHGGDVFINSEEFNFTWEYEFVHDTITYFNNNDLSDKPIFYLIQSMEVDIMGATFVIPSKLAEKHYCLIKNAMIELLDLGLMDDDQLLMIMASRKEPSLFDIKQSDWFLPIKDYGNKNLTTKELQVAQKSKKDEFLDKLRVKKRNYLYLKRFMKKFKKNNLE